mmetsp:Transcript_10573/g.24849  ORF Transcript_10573/g.24849 Transcript_10573/m.24849 type:complete len:213 (+) Transcript_10573:2221-2859(+)
MRSLIRKARVTAARTARAAAPISTVLRRPLLPRLPLTRRLSSTSGLASTLAMSLRASWASSSPDSTCMEPLWSTPKPSKGCARGGPCLCLLTWGGFSTSNPTCPIQSSSTRVTPYLAPSRHTFAPMPTKPTTIPIGMTPSTGGLWGSWLCLSASKSRARQQCEPCKRRRICRQTSATETWRWRRPRRLSGRFRSSLRVLPRRSLTLTSVHLK